MRRRWLVTLLLFSAGCYIGPAAEKFRPSRAPQGASVEAATTTVEKAARTELRGELLELRDEGLLVLGALWLVEGDDKGKTAKPAGSAKPQVILLPFEKVTHATFPGLGPRWDLADGRPPEAALREKLRLVSRFPQGLTPELMTRLLAAQGQAEVQRFGS